MDPSTDLTLWQSEHEEWDRRNFPNDDARLDLDHSLHGVFEECGELAHAHLKAGQGIRGTQEEHAANAKDAIGDACVYLMGVTTKCGLKLIDCIEGSKPMLVRKTPTDTMALHYIGIRLGQLIEVHTWWVDEPFRNRVNLRRPIGKFFRALERYCDLQGWSIYEILDETWGSVKQRDWVAHPDDADKHVPGA